MALQGARVLVSGASGFIGRLLCKELARRGCTVIGLSRRLADGPWHRMVLADLGSSVLDTKVLDGVDTIFHLAGKAHTRARLPEEIREYEAVHVHGTRALLHAAKRAGVRCVVLMSTVKAMGEGGNEVWDEDRACSPRGPYGVTKLAAERLVLDEAPVPCPVVLRPTLVYGAGSKGNLDLMMRAVRKGLFPPVSFPPNARSMIHVSDVVQACLLAASLPQACGRTYILSDGQDYSTRDVYRWVCEALGKAPREILPFGTLRLAAKLGDMAEKCRIPFPLTSDSLAKLAGNARFSNAKISRELGFVPGWHLRDGIREMVEAMGRA